MKKKKTSRRSDNFPNPLQPPDKILQIYNLLWQLETWLREMVYIELRARHVNWQAIIARHTRNWPPNSLHTDKRYSHMATRHQSAISYLTTGELFKIIGDATNWPLFESYFPPKNIFDAKVEEISQIRHRAAHFRTPHEDDLARLTLFLRDLDSGVWRFCAAYCGNNGRLRRGVSDPISQYFKRTHPKRHIVEMHPIGGTWLYADDRIDPALGFYLYYSVRPWAIINPPSLIGLPGVVYHAGFRGLGRHREQFLPHESILQATQHLHSNCIHVKLEMTGEIKITVPSILGKKAVCETIEQFLQICCHQVGTGYLRSIEQLDRIANEWPEYVLPPTHPLEMLSEDTPCQMFSYAEGN